MSVAHPERAEWLARTRRTWNEYADGWSALHDALTEEHAAELLRTVDVLGIGPGTRVLDAGCGPGQWAVAFAQAGAQVTVIDLAPAMLAHATRRAERAGVRLQVREGDLIEQLAGGAATFDVIHCRCVLQFAPDLAGVLRAFGRVLAPGGRLLTAVPGGLSPIYRNTYRRFLEPMTNNRVTPWELERLLAELGWTVLEGWGAYRVAGNGEPNAFSEPDVLALPLRLQQAAATYWVSVAVGG